MSTQRGRTTPASTNGSWKPHTGSRSRIEPDDDGEMLTEPSDRDILERHDSDGGDDELVEIDFAPLDWNTDFTPAQRLAFDWVGLSIDDINGYRAAGVDDYQMMREYDVRSYNGALVAAYASQGCGANEGLMLHIAGVTPKAWATFRADDPEITPVEAVALKKAKIGKQMFTELRQYGVTDPEQMAAIAKRFSGKELATWRRQGVTLADLYDEGGALAQPRPVRLALVRDYGLDPKLAERIGGALGDDARLDSRIVDRAVRLMNVAADQRNWRYNVRGWAESDTPIELAERGMAAGADYEEAAATAAKVGGDNALSRVIATIERMPDQRDVHARTVMLSIAEFSGVRPLTDSELDDAALLADAQPHNRYFGVITTSPGGVADSRGYRRPEFDPASMSELAATARATGNPRLFLGNLSDYQRSRSTSEPMSNVVTRAASAARIGRSKSEMDRAIRAGAKTTAEIGEMYAELDAAADSLGFIPESVGPAQHRSLRL